MYGALLIAALNLPAPVHDLPDLLMQEPAPVKKEPAPVKQEPAPLKNGADAFLVPIEKICPLWVPPIPHSTDAFPGEIPVPPAPRLHVDRQMIFPNQAILVILLPTDAVLYVNTFHIPSVTDRRAFVTIDLPPGKAFYYDLKVRVMREYRPYVQWQRVVFRAGERVVVSFGDVGCGVPFELGWH
jgi:uncharacterized protein (TIGR03000 family)